MSRAAVYDQVGAPEVLRVGEVADAQPSSGEVLLRVRAAGLNPFDAKVRSGFIPSEAPFPRRIGNDVAGTVLAVGEGALYWNGTPVQVGDEVLGRAAGSVAEQVIAQASDLTPRPENLSVAAAGGLNVAGLTAVSLLATVPVGSGDTVLVGGASGAVGLVATQLAMKEGARVIATASERNHELLRSLGAIPVAHDDPRLADSVAEHGTVTAVYDCHGRAALDLGVELGVPVDRMAATAAYGALEELGVHNVERDARTAKNLSTLAADISAGHMVFPVAQTFSLDEVVQAFEAVESSHTPGKIVILP